MLSSRDFFLYLSHRLEVWFAADECYLLLTRGVQLDLTRI